MIHMIQLLYIELLHSCQDTEGVDLYKGAFSLAYGTLTLLRDAKMHLKRNRRWDFRGIEVTHI